MTERAPHISPAPRVSIIVAVDREGAIGRGGELLFHISADLKRFKALTTGHTVIMGRNTFDSLPRGALPNRRNIVLSRREGYEAPGCEVFHSLSEALANCGNDEQIFIIGGAKVYKDALDLANRLEITEIDAVAHESDTFFPDFDRNDWKTVNCDRWETDLKSKKKYRFTTLERRQEPDGVGVKKTMEELERVDVEGFKSKHKLHLTVVLDNIRSLNNLGSIFRSADAMGIEKLMLCGITATPPSPAIHKTALGAEDSVSWQYFPSALEAVNYLKGQGVRVLCLEQVKGSVNLYDYIPQYTDNQHYAVVVGNEVDGVDQSVVDACHGCLEIPQCGTKHSLNVAVSAALAMAQFFRNFPNYSNL